MLQERTTAVKNAIRYYKDDKKKRILVLGAGRSATTAIDYFLEHAPAENWLVRVGDANLALAESKVRSKLRLRHLTRLGERKSSRGAL